MRYVMARIVQEDREHAYRIYITDCLKAYLGTSVRYLDLFKPTDDRKAEDVIEDIKQKLRNLE